MAHTDADFTNDDGKRARQGPDAEILKGDHVQCIQCHRLNSRVSRMLKNQGLTEEYSLVDEPSKQKLMADGAELFGDALNKMLTEKMTDSKISRQLSSFTNLGHFKDKTDLQDKYKSKPDQLANVLANCETFFCPKRQVLLYADPEYKLEDTRSTDTSRAVVRQLEQEEKVKPAKKAKATPKKATAAEGEVGDPNVKALSEAQTSALNKLKEKADTMELQGCDLTKRLGSHGVVHHVPSFLVQKFDTAFSALVSAIASITLAVELEKCNLMSLRQEVATAMKDLKPHTASLEKAIEAAESHLGVQVEPSPAAVAAGA